MPEIVYLVALLAATSAFGLFYRWRNGRMRAAAPPAAASDAGEPADAAPRPAVPDLAGLLTEREVRELGGDVGERATLVQFSSAFCQPCRATRLILADVSSTVPGVAHVEVAVESHLDLVRRFDVRRTPTVLVLDSRGRVVRRASGQPRKSDVLAALDDAMSGSL